MQISETHAHPLKSFGDCGDFAVIAMAHGYGSLVFLPAVNL
jgi:hypothetical protein